MKSLKPNQLFKHNISYILLFLLLLILLPLLRLRLLMLITILCCGRIDRRFRRVWRKALEVMVLEGVVSRPGTSLTSRINSRWLLPSIALCLSLSLFLYFCLFVSHPLFRPPFSVMTPNTKPSFLFYFFFFFMSLITRKDL